jgi:hypothetical protein
VKGNKMAQQMPSLQDSFILNTISECQPAWLEVVRASYINNAHASKWIQKLQQGPDPKGRFTWKNNLLYFRQRIWLGGSVDLQQKTFKAFHASTVGRYSGSE